MGDGLSGSRLDQALASLADLSRSQARRWIDEGRVRVNDARVAASHRVKEGDLLAAEAPEPRPSPLEPEAIPLVVLYEDEDVVVIDKPAGMVVHPAPGHSSGTLVNALLHHCGNLAGVGGVLRPGIVHRLDRGTSGVLVAAKHDAAHRALALQFHDHTVTRVYRALVRGVPGEESGSVARPIGRHPRDRKRMSVAARRARDEGDAALNCAAKTCRGTGVFGRSPAARSTSRSRSRRSPVAGRPLRRRDALSSPIFICLTRASESGSAFCEEPVAKARAAAAPGPSLCEP